ncbi:MAG TPA: ABC transporter substrate-binding protein [Clostridia bacterium]|nr:ABC transporter substrate-binding protein [Clostridia bacterium]
MKKRMSLLLVFAIIFTAFVGCNKNGDDTTKGYKNKVETIRFLNSNPELADEYEHIVAAYKDETGVQVIVETASSNTYESTLKAKMATSDAPTIFQINGPKGYATWKGYCAELSKTKLYSILADKSLAVSNNDDVHGIPYAIEGYGIIYNQAITDMYFEMSGRESGVNSMSEINTFAEIKGVVEEMTAKKADLNIDGVFASTSLKSGEDWRWQTQLANVPLYYEFKTNNINLTSDQTNKINFKYSENYKNIFDLYINNSTVDPRLLGSKSVDDSMAEFALGECVMIQNGNWAWGQISGISGNTVEAEDIKFLPIFIGVEDEGNQGLCIGTENFLCINSKATEDELKAADEFLYWLYSSEKGKSFVTNALGFITPFSTFDDNEKPTDPLAQEVIKWVEKGGVATVPWNFTVFPSQTFKDDFGSALLQYAQGSMTWEEVTKIVVETWKTESDLAAG